MTGDKHDWRPVTDAATPMDETCNGPAEPLKSRGAEDIHRPGPVDAVALPIEEDGPPRPLPEASAKPKAISAWGVALWTGGALFFLWLVVGLFQTIQSVARGSYIYGIPIAILAVVFLAALLVSLVREVRAFREINHLLEESRALAHAANGNNVLAFLGALEPRLKVLRKVDPEYTREFDEASKAANDVHRVQQLFDNMVLPHLASKADDVIEREALRTCVAVAILPHPALDAAVVVWRGCMVVRKVGEVYGMQMTVFSSVRLLKHVIASATLAAAAETLGEIVAEESPGRIIAPFIKTLGEASITYIRICRLGTFCKEMMVPRIQTL